MDNVVALVTLYYPRENVIRNMENISEQVSRIILLDNTPDSDNSIQFHMIKNVQYVQNNSNLGLSAAFNKGLSIDCVQHSDYIVFFDQDSFIGENLIAQLIKDFVEIKKKYRIGCIGPSYLDTNTGETLTLRSKKEIGINRYIVNTIITSSMLSTYEILRDIEFWNSNVFLDLADWDLCWRLQEKKYVVCLTNNVKLTHTLGEKYRKLLFYKIRQSKPIREYYQIRDSIKLFSKKYVPLKYKIRFLIMWIIMPVIYIVFLPERVERSAFVKAGFVDGILRKHGEFSVMTKN